jgi:hypothetical protein
LEENIGNVNGHAGAQGARRNGSSHLGFVNLQWMVLKE